MHKLSCACITLLSPPLPPHPLPSRSFRLPLESVSHIPSSLPLQFRGDTTVFLHPDRLAAGGCSGLAALCSSLAARLQPWLASQGYDVGGRPTFQLGCERVLGIIPMRWPAVDSNGKICPAAAECEARL